MCDHTDTGPEDSGGGSWNNPVPKACGADVELGNFVQGGRTAGATGDIASRLLLQQIPGIGHGSYSGWTSGGTCAQGTGWGNSSQDWGRRFLPSNGGCAYIDLKHLELCTPEVVSAYQFVAAWHAMLLVARQAQELANAQLPDGQRVQVLVNNTDGRGNSYGGHLNWLLSRRAWDNIFLRKPHWLAYLASYQVSSLVFAGQGKVGAENGAPAAAYQLSQRSDFFAQMTGPQTTLKRPLVNSRDEPLCRTASSTAWKPAEDPQLARLHCIFYDSNLCHAANLLKCGVMQIVLAMLEVDRMNPMLILDDPLKAVRRFSHDPTLKAKARMASGQQLSAVELQLLFFEEAQKFYDRGGCRDVVPRAGEILALYGDTLEKLRRRDLAALAGRLDWVLKLHILERAMAGRPKLNWNSPELKHLDHLYSSLDPTEGLYWIYEKSELVERVVRPGEIERLVHEPPENTRAYARAMLLRMAGPEQVVYLDWDSITFRLPGAHIWPAYCRLDLDSPLSQTRDQTQGILESGKPLAEMLEALRAHAPAARDITSGTPAHDTGRLDRPALPPPQKSASCHSVAGQFGQGQKSRLRTGEE